MDNNVDCIKSTSQASIDAPSMTAALKHRTISSAIGTQLRDAVLSGVYPSGAQLRQDALAARFGVSRIPVREALLQLEAEGLVRIVPHKGAVVAGLSQAEVDDVFALRRLLEARLLRRSAPRLTEEDFQALDRIQRAFGEAIRGKDAARWGVLNAELHTALYRRADLPRTSAIVANLLTASERYTRIQLSGRAAWQRAQAEHGELIDLCRRKETEAACALLERHIAAVHDDLAAMMARQPAA
jgi:DNA-binding GntR family transcriptional regulator